MCHFNQGALQPKNETIPIYQVEGEKRGRNEKLKLKIINHKTYMEESSVNIFV